MKVACPEEICFYQGWVDAANLERPASTLLKNQYGQYLQRLLTVKLGI
jgi:glucose-1-phosphate thymidylyltransferase